MYLCPCLHIFSTNSFLYKEKVVSKLYLLMVIFLTASHVELRQTLMSVSANCHFIERLFFESSKTGKLFSHL